MILFFCKRYEWAYVSRFQDCTLYWYHIIKWRLVAEYLKYFKLISTFIAEEKILYLRPDQEKDKTHFVDKDVSITNPWPTRGGVEYIKYFCAHISFVTMNFLN